MMGGRSACFGGGSTPLRFGWSCDGWRAFDADDVVMTTLLRAKRTMAGLMNSVEAEN